MVFILEVNSLFNIIKNVVKVGIRECLRDLGVWKLLEILYVVCYMLGIEFS